MVAPILIIALARVFVQLFAVVYLNREGGLNHQMPQVMVVRPANDADRVCNGH